MNHLTKPRFLVFYSGFVTLAFVCTVLCGATMMRNQTFGIITARRINIVEPDGTVRMTISNRSDFPGAWNRKKEYPRPDRRDAAGLLFMNDEGTEQGGLIWGAGQLPGGSIENHSHLSFDQYEENQVFAIDAGQDAKEKFSQITMTDQGDYPIDEKRKANEQIEKLPTEEQGAAWSRFFATHRHDVKRLTIGRSPDGSVGLTMRDANGKVRMTLAVDSKGEPSLQLYDAAGKAAKQFALVER